MDREKLVEKMAELTTLRAEVKKLKCLLGEIEADAYWSRSHAALRAKINAALEPKP